MAAPKLYRRLATAHRFGIVAGGWSSLYLASDHLLLRSTSAFVETYRRFYFRDIEAITICKSMRGYLWSAALCFPLFFFCIYFVYRPGWFPGIAINIFFAALLINFVRGPTSRATLQTRVQSRPLPLARLRPALRIVTMLQEKITAAQADIPVTETVPIAPRSVPPPLTEAGQDVLPPPLPGQPPPARLSWVHLLSFGVLIAGGLVCFSEAQRHRPALIYWAYAAIVLNLGWGIAALVRQRFVRLPSQVMSISWINVTLHILAIPIVYFGFVFAYALRGARSAQATRNFHRTQMQLSDLRLMPGFTSILFYYAIVCVTLGAMGYLLVVTYRWKAASQPRSG